MSSRPLALIAGRIQEHPVGGSYPLIRMVAGRLWAGGAGRNVYLFNGRMVELNSTIPYVTEGYVITGYSVGDAHGETPSTIPYVTEGYVTTGYSVGDARGEMPSTIAYVTEGYVTGDYVAT